MKASKLQVLAYVAAGLMLASLAIACAPARPAAKAAPQVTEAAPTITPTQAPTGTTVGMQAPDFALATTGGKTVHLSDYRGQVVLLNFWATWCGPCRSEVPGLVSAYERYRGQGFTVVAVNLMEPKEKVIAFADGARMAFPVLLDADGAAGSLYVGRGLPTSYLLDRDGIVRRVVVGAMPDEVIVELIEPLLGS